MLQKLCNKPNRGDQSAHSDIHRLALSSGKLAARDASLKTYHMLVVRFL